MKTHSGDTGMIWYDRVRFKPNKDMMFKRCLLQVLLASLPAQGWVWNWLPWPKGPGLPTKTHSLRSQSSETYSAQTRRPGAVLVVADWWGTRVTRTPRLIYFDADIVILGDLADIFARALRLKMSAAECKSHVTAKDMDMEGKPCAAVPYCHQKHGNSVHRSGTRSKEIEPPMWVAKGVLKSDINR